MSKISEVIAILHSVFYGEYWYIPWGIILLLLIIAFSFDFPKLVKSFREAKQRENDKQAANVHIFSGEQGNGKKHDSINNH